MAAPDPTRIRHLALIGYGGVGKTTLAGALLATAGVAGAPGRLVDGTSHFDTEPEERRRGGSILTAFDRWTLNESEVLWIDTPGAGARSLVSSSGSKARSRWLLAAHGG